MIVISLNIWRETGISGESIVFTPDTIVIWFSSFGSQHAVKGSGR